MNNTRHLVVSITPPLVILFVGDAGRVFTILLVATGVGLTLYVAAAVVQFMVEGLTGIILGRIRLGQKINRLKNHYTVCGYGRIGRVNCRNLRRNPQFQAN